MKKKAQKLIFESYLCPITLKKDSIEAKIKINMLIKSIGINNFRCFHKTEAKDFSNINLLGGKNNAGKTALLEALFLVNEIQNQSPIFLLKSRGIDTDFIKSIPEKAFDSFFYDVEQEIQIGVLTDDVQKTQYEAHLTKGKGFPFSVRSNDKGSTLLIQGYENGSNEYHYWIQATIKGYKVPANGSKPVYAKTYFLTSGLATTSEQLGQQFDKLKYEGHSEILLGAFKIIDATIDRVDSFNIGKPAIYLRRTGGNFMHLSLFGDAMTKIATYILAIIGNQNSVLLIDEIENGIHHTNHKHLWKMLFDLSQTFGIQLFATTHSAEMIEAFKDTIKENEFQNQARYFELARHSVSNEIIVQKIPMNALEQKLITKKPMRGE